MIRKLRLKFIKVAMGSFALVLLLVLAVINILNYREVVGNAEAILEILAFNSGAFPEWRSPPGPELPKILDSPELPFENRFFSAIVGEKGEICMTDTRQIAAVDEAAAEAYALDVLASGKTSGWLGVYRYAARALESGERLVVFLDCGRSLSSFRSYLRTSALLYLCALAAVFILLALLSGRIVRPISESYEKQKQFVSNAGHDIKTPLTIIDADAEVLGMDLGENEWVQDIKAQTRQLAALTGSLIELSRMEEPKAFQQMIEFPFSDLVAELCQSCQGRAKLQNKTLSATIQPMLPIYGSEKALRQLVSILLDNALKYSPEGSAIGVRLEKKSREVQLTVVNDCAPITREQLSHLFDRFYRADASRTPDGGYGIGLSIAKAVAEAHKGKIVARSENGRSLTMTFSLPAGKMGSAYEIK